MYAGKCALDTDSDIDVEIGFVRKDILKRRLLVLARRSQGVDARKINDANRFSTSVLPLHLGEALLLFNRHPRPIADVLMRTRQSIEKRRLPAIRIADKANRLHLDFISHA